MKTTAPVIIYKPKTDCADLVPVRLSEDGSKILSFPAPSDLRSGDRLRQPIQLKNGYFLDQMGVGPQSAFLSLSYAEYAQLEKLPDPQAMLDLVQIREPFEEIYYCGRVSEYKELVKELNAMIRSGDMGRFRSLF